MPVMIPITMFIVNLHLEEHEPTSLTLNEAFDSLFYSDRTWSKLWKHYLPTGKTTGDLLSYTYQLLSAKVN